MAEMPSSHHNDLLNNVSAKELLHEGGVPVEIISPLMERKDNDNIFDEGEAFSGLERQGNAEACITPVPSPHIQPELPKERLKNAAEDILGKEVTFPSGFDSVETLSAQLLVWWREAETNGDTSSDGRADILRISSMPPEQQSNFFSVIAKQSEKAVQIIANASNKPTIWGSWGYAAPHERLTTGRSRGIPTNKHGHLHVIDFGDAGRNLPRDSSLSAAEKLNHYAPWGSLLHNEFSQPIGRAINESISSNTGESVDVKPFTELIQDDSTTNVKRVNEGYEITFAKEVPISKAFESMSGIAGTFERFYQNATEQHEHYHKNFSQKGATESAYTLLAQEARDIGFTESEANRFAEFTLAIRPTFAQLSHWQEELNQSPTENADELERIGKLKELYERIHRLLDEDPDRDSFSSSLIRDTVARPEDYRSIGRTWAEHAGATYIIDQYNVTDAGIMVGSFRLLPGIDSTQSAPELMVGRILKRSTGNQ
jgi:hypothetical protein